jgi:hypothetical protein
MTYGDTVKFGQCARCGGSLTQDHQCPPWAQTVTEKMDEVRQFFEGAIAIKDLWLPPDDVQPDQVGEAQALNSMLARMVELKAALTTLMGGG